MWHMVRNAHNLQSLDISGNAISVGMLKNLIDALMSNADRGMFTELDLSECGLTDKGAAILAQALKHHPTLATVYLDGNSISRRALTLVNKAAHSSSSSFRPGRVNSNVEQPILYEESDQGRVRDSCLAWLLWPELGALTIMFPVCAQFFKLTGGITLAKGSAPAFNSLNSALHGGGSLTEGSIAHASASNSPSNSAAAKRRFQRLRGNADDDNGGGGTLELAAAAHSDAEGRHQATDSLVHRAKPWGEQSAPVVQSSDYTERWVQPAIGGVLQASFHEVTLQLFPKHSDDPVSFADVVFGLASVRRFLKQQVARQRARTGRSRKQKAKRAGQSEDGGGKAAAGGGDSTAATGDTAAKASKEQAAQQPSVTEEGEGNTSGAGGEGKAATPQPSATASGGSKSLAGQLRAAAATAVASGSDSTANKPAAKAGLSAMSMASVARIVTSTKRRVQALKLKHAEENGLRGASLSKTLTARLQGSRPYSKPTSPATPKHSPSPRSPHTPRASRKPGTPLTPGSMGRSRSPVKRRTPGAAQTPTSPTRRPMMRGSPIATPKASTSRPTMDLLHKLRRGMVHVSIGKVSDKGVTALPNLTGSVQLLGTCVHVDTSEGTLLLGGVSCVMFVPPTLLGVYNVSRVVWCGVGCDEPMLQSTKPALLKLHHGFVAKPARACQVLYFPGYPATIPNGHLELYQWQRIPDKYVTYVLCCAVPGIGAGGGGTSHMAYRRGCGAASRAGLCM